MDNWVYLSPKNGKKTILVKTGEEEVDFVNYKKEDESGGEDDSKKILLFVIMEFFKKNEECDDNNLINNNGCSLMCKIESLSAFSGSPV